MVCALSGPVVAVVIRVRFFFEIKAGGINDVCCSEQWEFKKKLASSCPEKKGNATEKCVALYTNREIERTRKREKE